MSDETPTEPETILVYNHDLQCITLNRGDDSKVDVTGSALIAVTDLILMNSDRNPPAVLFYDDEKQRVFWLIAVETPDNPEIVERLKEIGTVSSGNRITN